MNFGALFLFLFLFGSSLMSNDLTIDVVIPCHEKDQRTLNLVIDGIKKHGKNIRRVIIVSARRLTDNAEWFDESLYPFTPYDVLLNIFDGDHAIAANYSHRGWIYQQLLKLYAPFVIPDISNNVLVIDADTIFLNDVSFIDGDGYALYNVGSEYHLPYFEHGERLLPGFRRVFKEYSGICHHMLFQKKPLEDLFNLIAVHHNCAPWQALCKCIDKKKIWSSCLSEYEIYFNFIFSSNEYKVKLRNLDWCNMKFDMDAILAYQKEGYRYASCHSWFDYV